MDDIVERLRGAPIVMTENGYTSISKMGGAMLNEAADEIERLREALRLMPKTIVEAADEIDRLREALVDIANIVNPYEDGETMQEIARAALKEDEKWALLNG